MKTQPTASHFINGEYVEDTAGEVIECIYPATGEVIAKLHSATPAIIDAALKSARAAQVGWAKLSGTQRGRVLRRAADIMRERNRELSVLETYPWARIGCTRNVFHWVCALASARGIIQPRFHAGKARQRWHVAMRWCSNRLKQRRSVP